MCGNQAELFKVLGVDSRLRIIELLKARGPLCVQDLSQALGISPSAVSQHLKVMRFAGLVRNERKGYWVPYDVDPEALEKCREYLSKVCCCPCKCSVADRKTDGEKSDERLAYLKHYEKDLEKELKDVRKRIEELQE